MCRNRPIQQEGATNRATRAERNLLRGGAMPLANRQYSAVLLPLLVLVASAMALGLSASRGGFFDTTDNAGSYFDAAACTPGTSTYDFTGVTSPSSTHVALDGEIDETDAVIENGTFGARRDTITGWANWGEATSGEYSNLVTSDNLYYQGLDPGSRRQRGDALRVDRRGGSFLCRPDRRHGGRRPRRLSRLRSVVRVSMGLQHRFLSGGRLDERDHRPGGVVQRHRQPR